MPAINSELGMMNVMVDPSGLRGNEMNLVKEQEYLAGNMDDLRKSELLVDNLDSINHFYTHDSLLDDKLQHKLSVNVGEAEPLALTIHNDMSQKLPQKQPNVMINSYDKKLNHPNMQPGVSNVFNNFNEYMSVSLLNLDDENVASGMYNTRPSEGMVSMTDSCMRSFINHEPVEKCSIDDLLTTKVEDLMDDKKDHNAAPPKYQNILLPIKLDTCNPEKSSETRTDGIDNDLEFPDLMTDANQAASVFDKSDKAVKSILDEPEHVYENVYIGTDIPKTQEVFNPLNKPRKIDPEIEHTYENVNFGTQNISSAPHDKDGVYECIYISNRENLPETNTELEIAAKKIADHLSLKESDSQNVCPIPSASASTSTSTKPVIQNVQLDGVQVSEAKPVIGFTKIDDMSEEELSKYLAALEAEERANERASAVYENIPVDNTVENFKTKPLPIQQDDEDANEAPIFEAVTIGELPQVPHQDLQEKAKKFPVIDYNIGSTSGETSREFSCPKKPEATRISTRVENDESKVKKSKKTNEKVRKSSDNTEPTSQASSQAEQVKVSKEQDKENGNYVSANESDDKQNKLDTETLVAEENKSLNGTESTTSEQLDNTDNKYVQNNEQNINITLDDNTLANTRTPVRNTETISRFSVTRNVDVNDKLGGRSRPSQSQSHSIVKHTENNSELAESSDDDPNRPSRPQTLDVVSTVNMSDNSSAGIFKQASTYWKKEKNFLF